MRCKKIFISVFFYYSKAFDKVRHEKLFNILEHLDIDGKDLRVIRNIYWDQSAAVQIGGELSEYKLMKRGCYAENAIC